MAKNTNRETKVNEIVAADRERRALTHMGYAMPGYEKADAAYRNTQNDATREEINEARWQALIDKSRGR
ncbi:hypothetical protein [Streptosporangium roseum]|uniref:hypothetical protein n=1 Tax=Streptosporangium roseum TaxID=2001 RepID=UPI0004CC98AE|nr:hypothetical protein [Streptosporangium roseum]